MPVIRGHSQYRKQTRSQSYATPSLEARIMRGSEIQGVEDLRANMREYWPGIKNWKDVVGIPVTWFKNYGVLYQIAGRDKVGKSHLLSIIAAKHTQNHDVIYITTEFPAELIHEKMLFLGANPDRIIYIDFSKNPVGALGEAKTTYTTPFFRTPFYQKFTEAYQTASGSPILVVIDSMTSFYESQEFSARALAANIVRTVRYVGNVLAFGVSQKRTAHGETSTEVAGGLGVSHLMDGTFILYRYTVSPFKRVSNFLYTLSQTYGSKLTFLSWDGNRWGPTPPHDFLLKLESKDVSVELPVGKDMNLPEV